MGSRYRQRFLIEVDDSRDHRELLRLPDRFEPSDLEESLEELAEVWLDAAPPNHETWEWCCHRLDLDPDAPPPTMDVIQKATCDTMRVVLCLYEMMHTAGLLSDSDEAGIERKRHIQQIIKLIGHSRNVCQSVRGVAIAADPQASEQIGDDLGISSILFVPEEKRTNFQNLLLYTLKLIEQRGHRKFGNGVYSEVETPCGKRSHAWKLVGTIEEFIYENIQKETDAKQWLFLTNPTNNASLVAEHMQNSSQLEFPKLDINHKLFAFPNGLFDKELLVFWPFHAQSSWQQIAQAKTSRWQAMGVDRPVHPPRRQDVAIKFFEQPMPVSAIQIINNVDLRTYDFSAPNGANWVWVDHRLLDGADGDGDAIATLVGADAVDVTTPALVDALWARRGDGIIEISAEERARFFGADGAPIGAYATVQRGGRTVVFVNAKLRTDAVDKVLDDQCFEADTKQIFFQQLGRLGFDVGEHDNWQILMFIKGIAGSGKSTVATLMKAMYPSELTCNLSSNAESKFGLSAIVGKKLCICPEVKNNFAIPQGDLQSAISGEDVSISEKFKTARTVRWTVPFLFCGNEVANWRDAAGSMKRRLLIFEFTVKVRGSDPQLPKKMASSMPSFLAKISLAYQQAAYRHSNANLWENDASGRPILSRQLKKWAENMRKEVDPLYNFLKESGKIEMQKDDGVDYYMLEDDFIRMFQEHCTHSGVEKPRWSEDLYRDTFADHNLVVALDDMVVNGAPTRKRFIKGCRVAGDAQ